MSILGTADPQGWSPGLALAVLAGAAAVSVAALTGLLRLSGRAGAAAPRVPADRPLAPLGGVLFLGVLVWVGIPSLYFQASGDDGAVVPPGSAPAHPEPVPTTAPGIYDLTARQIIALSAGVPVLAFIVMAVGDAVVRPAVGQRLGFAPRRFPRGAIWGAVGIVLALPLVYCVMVLAAWVYGLMGYKPPAEHELLRTIGETPDPVVKYLAVIVAVVVAPLFEELLFRGHLQTLIREGLVRLRDFGRPRPVTPVPMGFPVTGMAYDPPPPPPPLPLPPVPAGEPEGAFAPEPWLAIAITSLLFAAVHQPWQFPPIFCLSLCLGLAYERTGNLWAPVVMHALFNGVMTTLYLFSTAN